jgi:hypothetical protein
MFRSFKIGSWELVLPYVEIYQEGRNSEKVAKNICRVGAK